MHRSTLSRQLKKGLFSSHRGRVDLEEVKRGRGENLHPNRGDRWRGRSHDAAKFVAPGAADATEIAAYSRMRGALVKVISVAGERIAAASVAAGAPMAVAYTTSIIGRMELHLVADELLRGDDYIDLSEKADGPVEAPNWSALAALAGEDVDLEAWEAYCAGRPWWKD